MGVLNVTPDSFHDGGQFLEVSSALTQAKKIIEDGATILDIGAESTRPGAQPLSVAEELARLTPIVGPLCRQFGSKIIISIDTRKSEVARAMLESGAQMINDVTGLSFDPKLATVVAQSKAWLVLSHIFGEPETMQLKVQERKDVVADVLADVRKSIDLALAQGVAPAKILIDPGFGFGKSHEQNLQLLAELRRFKVLGYPIVVGLSRKKTTGIVLQQKLGLATLPATSERLFSSLAAHLLAVERGATVIRTHDVREHRDAVAFVEALYHVQ